MIALKIDRLICGDDIFLITELSEKIQKTIAIWTEEIEKSSMNINTEINIMVINKI